MATFVYAGQRHAAYVPFAIVPPCGCAVVTLWLGSSLALYLIVTCGGAIVCRRPCSRWWPFSIIGAIGVLSYANIPLTHGRLAELVHIYGCGAAYRGMLCTGAAAPCARLHDTHYAIHRHNLRPFQHTCS